MNVLMDLLMGFLVMIALAAPAAAQEDFFKAVSARDLDAVRSMLDRDPSLAAAHRASGASAVTAAMFSIAKGEEEFHAPASNQVLQAILARKPELDLYEIAALGTLPQLETMLRGQADAIRKPNRFGWTALHMAAFAGNVATAQYLLEHGAEVNVRAVSRFRNTPLQTALLTGQYATAKLLLDHGADPLVRQAKGFAPLHEAALLGRRDLVELLLERGAEINSRSDSGATPLGEALRGHHDELAALMKAKGAVIDPVPDEETAPKKK